MTRGQEDAPRSPACPDDEQLAAYTAIAGELEVHASEELSHAIQIAKQIDYFNGTPALWPGRARTAPTHQERVPQLL